MALKKGKILVVDDNLGIRRALEILLPMHFEEVKTIPYDNSGGSPMTEELIADFRDAFKTFDTDEDGYLSLKELGDLLISLGHPVSKEELTEMTSEIDIEGNGTIDFKEFILLMARKMRDYDNEDEYIEAFRIFDKNKDDLISKEELKEAMTIIGQFVWGESPTDEDIAYMIREADTDGDDFLHYSDFIKKIKSIH